MEPKAKWTDERLDDLNGKVDRGFADVKSEMREGFARVNSDFERLDTRFDRLDARFDRLQQTLIIGLLGVVVSILGSNAF